MHTALLAILFILGMLFALAGAAGFASVLQGWGYSDIEVAIAACLPAVLGVILSSALHSKYWRGFGSAFVLVAFGIVLLLRLQLPAWGLPLYAILFCCAIMFGVQTVVMWWRNQGAAQPTVQGPTSPPSAGPRP